MPAGYDISNLQGFQIGLAKFRWCQTNADQSLQGQ